MQNTQTINKNDFIYKPLVLHPKWNKPVKYPVHSYIWRHQFFIKYSYQILQQYPVLQNNFKISLWMLLLKKKKFSSSIHRKGTKKWLCDTNKVRETHAKKYLSFNASKMKLSIPCLYWAKNTFISMNENPSSLPNTGRTSP